jgi:hypothetical protein
MRARTPKRSEGPGTKRNTSRLGRQQNDRELEAAALAAAVRMWKSRRILRAATEGKPLSELEDPDGQKSVELVRKIAISWATWDKLQQYSGSVTVRDQLAHLAKRYRVHVSDTERDPTVPATKGQNLDILVARLLGALVAAVERDDATELAEPARWAARYSKNLGPSDSRTVPRPLAREQFRLLAEASVQKLAKLGDARARPEENEAVLYALRDIATQLRHAFHRFGFRTPYLGWKKLFAWMYCELTVAEDPSEPLGSGSRELLVRHALVFFGVVSTWDDARNWMKG